MLLESVVRPEEGGGGGIWAEGFQGWGGEELKERDWMED